MNKLWLVAVLYFQAISLCYGRHGIWKQLIHRKHYNVKNTCKLVSSFTPDFCSFPTSRQYCQKFCEENSFEDRLTCGNKKPLSTKIKITNQHRVRRIVGGQTSERGEWPWQVSLRINGTQWCGGSILSEKFILTAAHCFDENVTSTTPGDWHIYAGDHELYADDYLEQRVRVKRIFLHPRFSLKLHQMRKGDWVTAKNDIAIMELEEPINLSEENKGTLCLPDKRYPIESGRECHVVGWGHTSYNGTQPNHLMHAAVLIVPTSICNLPQVYNDTISNKYLLCAGYLEGGRDACNFDSGGAMVCPNRGRWYATGIVSSGFECARPNAYGLYTHVRRNLRWVVETIMMSGVKNPVII